MPCPHGRSNLHVATTYHRYCSRLTLFLSDYGDKELQSLSPLKIEDYLALAARFPVGHDKAGELKSADIRAGIGRTTNQTIITESYLAFMKV